MDTRILIVDDDPAVNKSLVNYLEDYEYNTQSALSAEEALRMVQNNTFDIGIIDLRLPKMDGEQLIIELNKTLPLLKFLIHTGSTEFMLTDELKKLGMKVEHVLNKPLHDMQIIVDYVEQLTQ